MRMTGLLQSGVVQVINPLNKNVIGYAFTERNARGQLQRWMLFEHPHNTLDIVPAPVHMARWSLADWRSKVAELWRPGSFYVWAQADVYRHDDVREKWTWKSIPPASHLPPPTYPDVGECDFQLDPTGGRVFDVFPYPSIEPVTRPVETLPEVGQLDPTGGRAIDMIQHKAIQQAPRAHEPLDVARVGLSKEMPIETRGLAFVVNSLLDPTNAEYWMLPATYEPAGESASVAITTGNQQVKSLQEFIEVANQGWGPGSTFVITGCVNYRGKAPPARD